MSRLWGRGMHCRDVLKDSQEEPGSLQICHNQNLKPWGEDGAGRGEIEIAELAHARYSQSLERQRDQ